MGVLTEKYVGWVIIETCLSERREHYAETKWNNVDRGETIEARKEKVKDKVQGDSWERK